MAVLAIDSPGEEEEAAAHDHERSAEAHTGPDVREDHDRDDPCRQ